MKKKILVTILLTVLLCMTCSVGVFARSSTTYTYTVSVDGSWIRTQDAYVPGGILLNNAGFVQPEDIFINHNKFYVADTGNKRVVIYDKETADISVLGEGIFTKPTGIFVTDDETVYVADVEAPAVYIFSKEGELIQTIGTPDSYLFGTNSVFAPKNVVVSSEGNIYVVGDGAHEGLLQFDYDGTFQGYFAANSRALTLLEMVQDLIYTDEQKATQLARMAQPIYNIDITEQDLLYSVTQATDKWHAGASSGSKAHNLVQLHNLGGTDILAKNMSIHDEWNFVDVAHGIYSNCYAVTQTGLLYEYDSSGNLIFSFGGRAMQDDKNGLVTDASAVAVDAEGIVYVLDRERALIQVFVPTDFAIATHQAIYDLDMGNYDKSEQTWNDVLRLNGMSKIAHLGLGKTLLHQQRYEEALEQFEIVGDKENYSTAFWEMRNVAIHEYSVPLIAGLIVLILAVAAVMKRRKKLDVDHAPKTLWNDLRFLTHNLRHPIDALYYLNREERGSVLSATILYGIAFIIFVADMMCRSFLFRFSRFEETSPFVMPFLFAGVIGLFLVGNYMVSSINDGRGSMKKLYVNLAYAIAPYIFITPFLIAVSYVLTLNEGFIVEFTWTIVLIWCFIYLFIMLSETHEYSFGDTIKNILLTIFFMIVVIVVVVLIFIFWKEIVGFVKEIIGEVSYLVSQ